LNENVDLNKILQSQYHRDQGVIEVDEKVGEWTFHIEHLPLILRIKVIRSMPHGKFMGIANYSIQNPKQGTPYRSLKLCDTVEEALNDALDGFLVWWDPKQVKQTKFELDKEW
jgi:hypothetical protein